MVKHLSLLISLTIIVFMAIFTETNISVTKDYILTPEQLKQGEDLYQKFCSNCHDDMDGLAPNLDEIDEWKRRLSKGMKALLENVGKNYHRNLGLLNEEIELAVAFMVKTSTSK
jgi:cytochrome c5